jgi:hypothetical protein
MKNSKLTDFESESSIDVGEAHPSSSETSDDEQSDIIDVYRHDAHKMNGEPHGSAPVTFAGVPVNRTVPLGADGDAAKLSRPSGKPRQTVENHETHYRLSLLQGTSQYDPLEFSRRHIESEVRDLLTQEDPERVHRNWINSRITSGFNESVYYPYTSLKYHTLLVVALYDNYESGNVFSDLRLVIDPSGELIPHRTVFSNSEFSLRIDADDWGRPSARLGSRPWRSWHSTWSRLTDHPLETDSNQADMVLDANLRRIGSWSTALQLIEDFGEVVSE